MLCFKFYLSHLDEVFFNSCDVNFWGLFSVFGVYIWMIDGCGTYGEFI